MYTFYANLNRLFRKTILPREGDPTRISNYGKNLLAAMREHVEPFSVIDFIWNEIRNVSLTPLKSCGYACYLMFLIENKTGKTFKKDVEHKVIKIPVTLDPIVTAPVAAAVAPSSPPPPRAAKVRARQQGASSSHNQDKPPSPLRKIFNMLFSMCRKQSAIEVRMHHERQERKKNTRRLKEIHSHLNLQPPCSPIGSEGDESEVETFEHQMQSLDQEDPFAMTYGSQSSSEVFGFSSGTFAAPPPPPPPSRPPQDFASAAVRPFFGGLGTDD